MPELPEVEITRQYLAPHWEGRQIDRVTLRRASLRYPFGDDFRTRLEGRRVLGLGRRAKYLLVDIKGGDVLIVHLGMSGALLYRPPGKSCAAHAVSGRSKKHDHVIFDLDDGAKVIYNDPRRFGFMVLERRALLNEHRLFRHLGIEPSGNGFTAQALADRCAGKSAPLKSVLMNQRILAGLGNIYVCESLYRARLSPLRPACTLALKSGKPAKRTFHLVEAVRAVLNEAIAAGGATLADFVHGDGTPGYFQHNFAVYGRNAEPCRRDGCRGTIRRLVQSARATYYCPLCQR